MQIVGFLMRRLIFLQLFDFCYSLYFMNYYKHEPLYPCCVCRYFPCPHYEEALSKLKSNQIFGQIKNKDMGTRPLGPKEKDGLLVPPGKASLLLTDHLITV